MNFGQFLLFLGFFALIYGIGFARGMNQGVEMMRDVYRSGGE